MSHTQRESVTKTEIQLFQQHSFTLKFLVTFFTNTASNSADSVTTEVKQSHYNKVIAMSGNQL